MKKYFVILAVCGFFAFAAPAFAADGTISGTVTHASDGTPVVGMWMSATNTSTLAISYVYGTGADGSYSLTLAPGTYDIASNTATSTESGVAFIKQTKTATIASGETASGQNFSLVTRGKFSGHIYAQDGVTPISGATISVVNVSGSTAGYAYTASVSNGTYIASPMPADYALSAIGTYTIIITRTGYFSAQVTGVALASDNASTAQDFTLTTGSSMTGTIVDGNGAGIAGATVTLTKSGSSFPYAGSYTTATNSSGAYTVSVYDISTYNSTAIGDYTLTISKSGYVTKTSTLSITSEGTALTGQNFTLATGKVFSGTVTAKSGGAAINGAVVSLYKRNSPRSLTPNFTYTTGCSGAFSMNTLSSGLYRLTIAKTGYAMIVVDSIAVTKDKTGLSYKLELGGTIKGNIYTGKNTIIDGATIYVYAINNGKEVAYTSTTSNDVGSYTVSGLKKGAYKFIIATTEYVRQTANVTVTGTATVTKNFKLATAGSVSGYITDKSTGLPASVWVKVVGTSIGAWSDSNGYYILDGVAPGGRKIAVVSQYYDIPKQKSVSVKAGKTNTGINFSLNPK